MLTRKMQVQAIADRLGGLEVPGKIVKRAKHFAEPWSTIWQAWEALTKKLGVEPTHDQLNDTMLATLADNPERDKILAEVWYAVPGGKYGDFQNLAQMGVDLLPITWLWKGWIPLGMLTLLGAAPGVGKTNLCLELARRVIHGENFPDGQACSRPRTNVLYVDAESVPQIINQRAISWDMDRTKLYLMHPDLDEILDFSIPKYKDRLTQMIAQLEPALVIIDSLSSVSSKGENNIEDVRALMGFLNMLAREYECAVVIIHHLRKHSGGGMQLQLFEISLDDFRGSSHIAAMARSVIGVSIVQTQSQADRNGPRRVEVVKTNLGPYPEALGFMMADGINGSVVLRWDTKAPEAYKEPTQRDEAREWLEDFLRENMEGKPVKPKEVVQAAAEEGISRALVFRARNELRAHIKNTEGRKSNQNCWQWSDEVIDAPESYEDDES